MAELIFWISSGLLIYTYVIYPIALALLAKWRGVAVKCGPKLPSVTIVVTAYNEQDCITLKLDNLCQADYPQDLLEILVVSDGSSDNTEAIARSYRNKKVRVLRVDGRRGKTACQNAAALAASSEILLFTDATTRVHPAALRKLVETLEDPTVGCVGGRLVYVTNSENATGAGGEAYWSYELRLRAAESHLGSLIGVSGCLYAVRKTAYRAIDPQLISDFVIAMRMREQGLRTVLAPGAVCFEETLNCGANELAMRIRVAIRSLNALVHERRFLNPIRYGTFAWQLWSHKVLRYASPLIWLCALASNLLLVGYTPYLVMFALQIAVISAGVAGFLLQNRHRHLGVLGRPYYFLLTNAASFIATMRYLRGERMVTWQPLRKTQVSR
jgi:cellulose synthase/poly-beta-1,6-N-acetylglucosamine synthase-like glycosyltransferase